MTGFHLRPLLLAATALVLGTAAAQAAPTVSHSVTHSASIPTGYVGTSGTADLTDFEGTIALPKIDPAKGAQIEAITVTLAGGVFGDYFATNPTNNRTYRDQTALVSAEIKLTAPGPSGTVLGVVLPLVSQTFNLSPRQTVSQSGISGFATATQTTNASNPDFSAIAPLFLGQGTVYLPFFATGLSRFSGSGNIRFGADTMAGGTATITVDYLTEASAAPQVGVPEPAGLALFGCGLLGLVAARRKRPETRGPQA